MKLAVYGACFVNCVGGEDVFWTETWIPGTMEMIVNNLDNGKEIPDRRLRHGSLRSRSRAHELRRVPGRRGSHARHPH